MPADQIRKTAPKGAKGKGSGLNKKVGGIPLKWWGVGLVAAIGIGLYLRNRAAASAATSPATSTTATPVDTSGGATGSGATGTGTDLTGLEASIAQLDSDLLGGFSGLGSQISTLYPQVPPGDTPPPDTPPPVSPPTPQAPPSTVTTHVGATSHYVGGTAARNIATAVSPHITIAAVLPQKAAPADVNPSNVLSVVRLKTGATLTTLVGGRQVEQAPGKTPYVVNKGTGVPAGK